MARINAILESRNATERDKADCRNDLQQVRGEVERAFNQFRVATEGQKPHGRIDDIDAALVRLLTHLPKRAG